MKKTYYLYYVWYSGEREDYFGHKEIVDGNALVKTRKPLNSADEIRRLEEDVKNKCCFVDIPLFKTISPLGKTRL